MNRANTLSDRTDRLLVNYIFPLGLIVQLTGVLWLNSHSSWVAQTRFWLLLPAVVSILLNIRRIRQWRPCWLEVFLVAFLGWAAISILWSDTDFTLWESIKTGIMILLYVYAIVRLGEYPALLKKVLVFCAFLVALGALVSLIYHYGLQHEPLGYRQYRIQQLEDGFAYFDHPIRAALYYGMFLGLLFMWQAQKPVSDIKLIAVYACIVFLGLYVLMTWSRGPWIAAGCSIVITTLLSKDKKTWCILIGVVVVIALAVLAHGHFFDHTIADDTFSGRTLIWKTAIHDIMQRPLFGYGFDASFIAHNPQGMVLYHPHCYYLQVLRQYGIIGFGLFIAVLICLARMIILYRHTLLVRLALAILVVSLVGMLTDVKSIVNRPSDTWIYLFLPVGLVLGAYYRHQCDQSSQR